MKCNICPRECGVDRTEKLGVCKAPFEYKVVKAMPHFWEEPPISGEKGSGAVFFSGCNLGCVYCQNYDVSHKSKGKIISDERLLQIFFELKEKGVHNINLVNPTHYAERLRAVLIQWEHKLPVVYNSSGYEKVNTLKGLEGLVDIYLPDLKYISDERSTKYSSCKDYFSFASEALLEMKRQVPVCKYDENNIMKKGLIVRHLILPKNTNQSIKILDWIAENLGLDTAISLMCQYTPFGEVSQFKELQRRITEREYEKVLQYAFSLGFETVFSQDFSSAREEFIPDFDFSGV